MRCARKNYMDVMTKHSVVLLACLFVVMIGFAARSVGGIVSSATLPASAAYVVDMTTKRARSIGVPDISKLTASRPDGTPRRGRTGLKRIVQDLCVL